MEKNPKSSSGTINSGSKANLTGNNLERFVYQSLLENGYVEFQGNKKQMFSARKSIGGKQFATQVPIGKTIYEQQRKADVLVINPDLFEDGLIIECKWQQASGSVDEKYPFLYLNIMKTNVTTIILLDGGGYSAGAEKWLRQKTNNHGALQYVWSMLEFQKEINNGFLG